MNKTAHKKQINYDLEGLWGVSADEIQLKILQYQKTREIDLNENEVKYMIAIWIDRCDESYMEAERILGQKNLHEINAFCGDSMSELVDVLFNINESVAIFEDVFDYFKEYCMIQTILERLR